MKKGFSLIELIAVIALLGVIITIASVSVTSLKKNSDMRLCEQKEKYIITSAIKYGQDHLNEITDSSDANHWGRKVRDAEIAAGNQNAIAQKCWDTYVIKVRELIAEGYIVPDGEGLFEGEPEPALLLPGRTYTFNDRYVCIKYEDINKNKVDDYASSYNYHGMSNYQVTAEMNYNQCNY